MERYICIHGHFYQPPRENPWLESIELQDSASPYHDWNERVTAECYSPNATARILDTDGRIERIVNNYSKISFNFGPTLLAWLAYREPDVYEAILQADRESQRQFGGHGSAIAQVYNHVIMPLANRRDKVTQVRWGIFDFETRFGRKPEGMWLAETAVDLETLDILAEHDIKWTILSPYQAGQMRQLGDADWQDVTGGRVDPTRAYRQNLPSGRSIDLFFYDGPISRGIAFEGILRSGVQFANRLIDAFSDDRNEPQLVHIATDGETYGHHHKHGEMALAYAINYIEANQLATLTNYGQFLELQPSTHEVMIIERTAWSCFHGVGRWERNCGCHSGGHDTWNQEWRAPLRRSLDWLRDTVAPLFEAQGMLYFKAPWAARDAYIEFILNREPENLHCLLATHASHELDEAETSAALKLLELQRHALLMYTSCGWFFDELSGIETEQVIMYAGRVLQLAREFWGDALEAPFLRQLEQAKSNLREHGDGRQLFETCVRPAIVDLPRVTAHYALSSLFESYAEEAHIYSHRIRLHDYQLFEAGRARLATGRINVTSLITYNTGNFTFGVLHLGDHNLSGGVRIFDGDMPFQAMVQEIHRAFERADLPDVIRLIDKHFPQTYALKSLFRDEQRHILDIIFESSITDATAAYRQIYSRNAHLMRFLTDLGTPMPRIFQAAAGFALNTTLEQAIKAEDLDVQRIAVILQEAKMVGVDVDRYGPGHALENRIEQLMKRFRASPNDHGVLQQLDALLHVAEHLPLPLEIWEAQKILYDVLQSAYPVMIEQAEAGDGDAQTWIALVQRLCITLRVQVPQFHAETAL